jgi:tryptophan-rich sensory protein
MMEWLPLGGFLVATFVAASSGAVFGPGPWYERLSKPSWNPPNWLFGPAWTLLYVLMSIAAWMVWKVAGFGPALWLWVVQLLLNGAWSWVFFGLKRPDLAFYELIGMWLAIVATTIAFAGIRADAAWLMAPYIAWVTFAGALNLKIWQLNGARPA